MKRIISILITGTMLICGIGSVFAAEQTDTADSLVLSESSHLKLDRDAGFVDMIDGTVTVAELKSNFVGTVVVAVADGTAKADDEAVATGDTVVAGDDSLMAIIYGDADGNGKVNIGDVAAALKSIAKWDVDISAYAADVDKNGKVNLADASKVLKKVAKWDDISLGNVRMVFDNTHVNAENENADMELFFTDMMNKLGRRQTENTGLNAFKMKMAKNETESCQALLLSDSDMEGLTAELTPFEYEFGGHSLESKLEWINYYDHNILTRVNPRNMADFWYGDYFPEIVLPMADSFELQSDMLQHLIISVTAGKDAPAGMYRAALNIKDADGKVIKTAYVYAYVWDFALPDAPYSASIFNTQWYGGKNDEYSYKDYYNFMLDNNLSAYVLPYDIDTPEGQAYMSDPRVSAFVIAGEGYGGIMSEDDEDTKKYFEIVQSNPEWAKKGLFYYTDEPWGPGLLNVKTTYEHLVDVLGTTEGIRNITPLAGNDSFVDEDHQNRGIDPVAYIDPYINVWCPQSPAFHRMNEGGLWTPRRMVSLYGEFPERAEAFKAKGEEMWWYVCCSPEVPYANYFTWYQGVILRVLLWQQYFNDVDGQLYYATGAHWDRISKNQFDIYNGDGVLMFPGEFFGRTGPCASWRLYQVRDGFDDFDYLRIAEELVGREAVMKVVNKVTSGMLKFTEDYRVLDACRDEIVQMILEAQK